MQSAHTSPIYLLLAGLVMVLSLVLSKKSRNVLKTSVDLSRQDEGDEMFGSSAVARVLVRNTRKIASTVSQRIPRPAKQWIDSRFNSDKAILPLDVAFGQIRTSVNLVVAGLLVAIGTSLKLPLSTTYVTFMVAMGTSLADRAWSRESAVFRITGVLSVIGGWFITAGAAFVMCYLVTNIIHWGSFAAMPIALAVAIAVLIRSNKKFRADHSANDQGDLLFKQLCRSQDKAQSWTLLQNHVLHGIASQATFAIDCYANITNAFLHDDYKTLRHHKHTIETAYKQFKRLRRREIIAFRKIDTLLATEKNTWYWMTNSATEQILYCLKRINDPCCEHIGNNFTPVANHYVLDFANLQSEVIDILTEAKHIVEQHRLDSQTIEHLRQKANIAQQKFSDYRKQVQDSLRHRNANIESTTAYLNIVQESQQILSSLRQMLKGLIHFVDPATTPQLP